MRLFNGLGGVELGVRHSGHKAMLFVRIRKLVIAGWWKAPGIAGKTPAEIAVERAEERRAAAGVANARPGIQPKGDSEVASLTTSASVSHAAGVTELGTTAEAAPPKERPRIPGRIGRPAAQVIEPESPAALADDQNVMHRLWKRFSSSFKKGR